MPVLEGNFEKLLSYLKSAPLNLSNCKGASQNKSSLIWDRKCLIWMFWGAILKNYCHIWNQCPRVCFTAKFNPKIKILKFRTKNVLFGYFWAGTLKNNYYIWNQRLQICLNANFRRKIRILKCWTENILFECFGKQLF